VGHGPELPGADQGRRHRLTLFEALLDGYARAEDEGDLESVRYAIAGAEPVMEQTQQLWAHFGTIILDGCAATEGA
jgi:hypothetical protein